MNGFTVLAYLFALLAAYPFVVFPIMLAVLAKLRPGAQPSSVNAALPLSVSVIVAARDEEARVEARIANIRAMTPPGMTVEIIIGSDGSTDDTVSIARSLGSDIVVHDFTPSRGRAMVHNDCVSHANGDVLIFTDAETHFTDGCIEAIAAPFSDPDVGVAVGEIGWINLDTGAATSGRGLYWKFELLLRRLMNDSDTLTKGSGPFMAVRRTAWVDLRGHEDVDVMTPIALVCDGYRVVHVSEALAGDVAPASAQGVFRAHRRMTRKTTLSLFSGSRRLAKSGHWKHVWAALSHKLLRFTSLATLGVAFVAGMFGGTAGLVLSAAIGAVLLVGGLGAAVVLTGRRIPIVSAAGTWILATSGMTAGVFDALRGDTAPTYQKVS